MSMRKLADDLHSTFPRVCPTQIEAGAASQNLLVCCLSSSSARVGRVGRRAERKSIGGGKATAVTLHAAPSNRHEAVPDRSIGEP